jgi:hypothetical protein
VQFSLNIDKKFLIDKKLITALTATLALLAAGIKNLRNLAQGNKLCSFNDI